MHKMRLCKLWPHSSALIYGKVLLVNSAKWRSPFHICKSSRVLAVTFAHSAHRMCSNKLVWRFFLRTVVLTQVNALELRGGMCDFRCIFICYLVIICTLPLFCLLNFYFKFPWLVCSAALLLDCGHDAEKHQTEASRSRNGWKERRLGGVSAMGWGGLCFIETLSSLWLRHLQSTCCLLTGMVIS